MGAKHPSQREAGGELKAEARGPWKGAAPEMEGEERLWGRQGRGGWPGGGGRGDARVGRGGWWRDDGEGPRRGEGGGRRLEGDEGAEEPGGRPAPEARGASAEES